MSPENSIGEECELNGWEKWQKMISDRRVRDRLQRVVKESDVSVSPEWIARRRRVISGDEIFARMTEEDSAELNLLLGLASYNKCRSEASEAIQHAKTPAEMIAEVRRIVEAHK